MNNLLKLLIIMPIALFVLSCEEETPDYAADIINTYILESIEYMGETFDFTDLPIEDAMLVKITRDEAITYENDEDHCEDTYSEESDEIDGVTETAILFTDGSETEYSITGGKLRLVEDGDVIILAAYNGTVPPASWTDPSLLTNDTYEPNNEIATATSIAAGGTIQNHYLGACGDEDYFMFSASAGVSYIMETISPLDQFLDLTLALYSGNGSLLDTDDDGGTDFNPSLYWTCQTSGDYYFVIEGFWDDDIGNYSVSVIESSALVKPIVVPEIKRARPEKKIRLSELLFN